EEPIERTVWNQGRVGGSKAGLEEESERAPAAQNLKESTARVVVHVESPEELGIGSQSAPRAFGDASALQKTPWRSGDGVERRAETGAELPVPGTEFLGFRILAELGRGSFGCVYLAQ